MTTRSRKVIIAPTTLMAVGSPLSPKATTLERSDNGGAKRHEISRVPAHRHDKCDDSGVLIG